MAGTILFLGVPNTKSTLIEIDSGYRLVEDNHSMNLTVSSDLTLQFANTQDGQSYQMLLLPNGGYATTPTQIRLGHPFYLEIVWVYRSGKRQRLVRRYDSTGKWESATFISEEIDLCQSDLFLSLTKVAASQPFS